MTITPRTIIYVALFNLAIGIGLVGGWLLKDIDLWLYNACVKYSWRSQYAAIESNGWNEAREIVLTPHQYGMPPVIPLVVLHDAAAAQTFPVVPPEPADWIVLLYQLDQHRVKDIYLSAPLTWGNRPNELVTHALNSRLKEFNHVTQGQPVTLSARGEEIPDKWQPLALKEGQYFGDISKLPAANKPFGEYTYEFDTIFSAPSEVENDALFNTVEEGWSAPLLIRWGNRIMPTGPLIAALNHLNLGIDDIHFVPGDKLRLGGQLSIPVDASARIRLRAEARVTTPADIIVVSEDNTPTGRQIEPVELLGTAPVTMVWEPVAKQSETAPSAIRDAKTIGSILSGIRPLDRIHLKPLSKTLLWILLIDITIIALWALRFTAKIRWAILVTCFLLMAGTCAYFLQRESTWIPTTTLTISLLVICASSPLVKPAAKTEDDDHNGDNTLEPYDYHEPDPVPVPENTTERDAI